MPVLGGVRENGRFPQIRSCVWVSLDESMDVGLSVHTVSGAPVALLWRGLHMHATRKLDWTHLSDSSCYLNLQIAILVSLLIITRNLIFQLKTKSASMSSEASNRITQGAIR